MNKYLVGVVRPRVVEREVRPRVEERQQATVRPQAMAQVTVQLLASRWARRPGRRVHRRE